MEEKQLSKDHNSPMKTICIVIIGVKSKSQK